MEVAEDAEKSSVCGEVGGQNLPLYACYLVKAISMADQHHAYRNTLQQCVEANVVV